MSSFEDENGPRAGAQAGGETAGGAARFVVLNEDGLHDEAQIDAICREHAVEAKFELWRCLEEAGRRYFDRRRLTEEGRPALARLRQDLMLGLRLCDQLRGHLPSAAQLAGDRAGVALNRRHLSCLREAERSLGEGPGAPRTSLEEAVEAVAHLRAVYEAALEQSGTRRFAGETGDPLDAWRASVAAFWTLRLGRAPGEACERFLDACLSALEARKPALEAAE